MKRTLLFLLTLAATSCNTMKFYYDEIKGYGFHPYKPVSEIHGTGSIIGGPPSAQVWAAHGQACFPDFIEDIPTHLRVVSNSSIPSKTKTWTLSGGAKVGLLNLATLGNATIGAGIKFDVVNTVSLVMEGVTIEHLNLPRVARYYRQAMDPDCAYEIENRAVVTQAMHVTKLRYKFYNRNGVAMNLSLANIEQILDIDTDFSYSIENGTEFVIASPRYVGMQVGIFNSEGRVTHIANRSKRDQWAWKSLNVNRPESAQKVLAMENEFALPPHHLGPGAIDTSVPTR